MGVGVAAASVLACSLGAVMAACGDSFTTTGGTVEAGVDAPTVTPEAGAGDTSVSPDGAPAVDSGARGDAGDGGGVRDGGGGSDGGAAGWCGAHPGHTFCEDFDEYPSINGLFGAWTSFQQTNGTFSFDTSNAPSAPNALDVAGTNGAQVLVFKGFPAGAKPSVLRLEFDLRFNSSGSVGLLAAVGIAAITFGPSVSDGYAALVIKYGPSLSAAWADSADAGPTDAGTFKIAGATGTFPTTGIWSARYAIEIDYSSTDTACVQVFQGMTPLLSPCLPLPPHLVHPGALSIVLGDYAAGIGGTGAINVEFDDVTFDAR